MTVLESHVQSPSAPAPSVPTASNGHGTAVGTLPRDPEARLETLFDPGTTRLLTPPDTSGVMAACGEIDGMLAVAFASDPKVQGGALGTEGCAAVVTAYEELFRKVLS